MAVTAYQLSLNGAIWVDANSRYSLDNMPDRLPDYLAISNSLFNLFNCTIGARGKIFQPEYGSEWYPFLQEPIDDVTASSMYICMIQAIQKWEPRIILDYSQTFVVSDLSLPGYHVQIVGVASLSKTPIKINFTENLG